MAKTWKDIDYDRMVSMPRIEQATWNAGKQKRKTISYLTYSTNRGKRECLHQSLVDETYEPLVTEDKVIFDAKAQKERTIRRPAFRDQIVHHAIMLELEPYFMKYIIKQNVACIPGRGGEYARIVVKSWTKRGKKADSRWLVQADVSKYYESAQSDVLMAFFKKKIRDKRVIALLQKIVDTFTQGFVLGYYICQWFGALYLSILDNMIKHELKARCYIRYVDNILIGFRKQKDLKLAMQKIKSLLHSVGLRLKDRGRECHRSFRWAKTFVDFVGVRTYRDGFQELRRSTYLKLRRAVQRIHKAQSCSINQARSILSRKGLVKNLNCSNLRMEIDAITKLYRMRRIVSNVDKQKNERLAG